MTGQPAPAGLAWARWPAVQDAALAGAVLVGCLLVNDAVGTLGKIAADPLAGANADQVLLWWAATALAMIGVALRRRWPVSMLVACVVAAATHLTQAIPLMLVDLSVPIMLYTIAVRHRRAASLSALTGLLVLATGWCLQYALQEQPTASLPDALRTLTSVQIDPPDPPGASDTPEEIILVRRHAWSNTWSALPVLGCVLVAAWAIGSGARSRRAYLEELRAHARDLERERDHRAALAATAERGRISRELHDVVAHGLSVMVIQAQGGAAALDKRPENTRTALEAIVRTGRGSLADIRRVLAAAADADHAWHPQPGLAQLSGLLAQIRATGTPVRLRVEGIPVALPATVDLSAYRIVQEALTNTIKHAGAGAAAKVVVSYRPAGIDVEVSDDGVSTVAEFHATGHGLPGMRERVRLLGGRLDAGPSPQGGFVVRASLPTTGLQA